MELDRSPDGARPEPDRSLVGAGMEPGWNSPRGAAATRVRRSGHIAVDEYENTSVKGVFAIGDVTTTGYGAARPPLHWAVWTLCERLAPRPPLRACSSVSAQLCDCWPLRVPAARARRAHSGRDRGGPAAGGSSLWRRAEGAHRVRDDCHGGLLPPADWVHRLDRARGAQGVWRRRDHRQVGTLRVHALLLQCRRRQGVPSAAPAGAARLWL